MPSLAFPDGFLWGAVTSAYQVEGAARDDGKGPSIWDTFCEKRGAIRNGDTGAAACDHYHLWRQDIRAMKDLGLSAYRFSVSWPRVVPNGRGKPNSKAIDFYRGLVDGLLEAGIQPVVTLYHWDLPQAMEDRGGWVNRDTASWFAEYAACMFKALDGATLWITLNEPWVSAFLGYGFGAHAPGIRDPRKALQASHVLMCAHALALRAGRDLCAPASRIGISLDLHHQYPVSESFADVEAARIADGFQNRWFLDPVLVGQYPPDMLALYERLGIAPRIDPSDEKLLGADRPDFLGINTYFPDRVRAVPAKTRRATAGFSTELLGFQSVVPEGCAKTEMGWEICPQGLYDLLIRLKNDYENPVLMITENGAACRDDKIVDGQVQDDDRIDYLRGHLREAHRAIRDGARLSGYFHWSLMDNFEWACGYDMRFGLMKVDFRTQERSAKKSAHWYRSVIAGNGAALEE